MMLPPGFRGAAFGSASDGDGRLDASVRAMLAARHGIPADWAYATQVHGSQVVHASGPGWQGDADALVTTERDVTLTIATADCVPLVLEGPDVVAVVHVGWRGAVSGVVEATLQKLAARGHPVTRAAIGPSIRPCCYEVGADVAAQFPDHTSTTSWGSTSVDLAGFVASKLDGVELWVDGRCTYTEVDLNSYRRDRTDRRQTAMAWLPRD